MGRGLAPGDIQTANKGVRLSALTDPDGNTITLIDGFCGVY
jgi:glyoxylase I family protein